MKSKTHLREQVTVHQSVVNVFSVHCFQFTLLMRAEWGRKRRGGEEEEEKKVAKKKIPLMGDEGWRGNSGQGQFTSFSLWHENSSWLMAWPTPCLPVTDTNTATNDGTYSPPFTCEAWWMDVNHCTRRPHRAEQACLSLRPLFNHPTPVDSLTRSGHLCMLLLFIVSLSLSLFSLPSFFLPSLLSLLPDLCLFSRSLFSLPLLSCKVSQAAVHHTVSPEAGVTCFSCLARTTSVHDVAHHTENIVNTGRLVLSRLVL